MSETETFRVDEAIAVLERTPAVLAALIDELPDAWIVADEGPETWSPFDILGHLVHGERADWLTRTRTILEHGESVAFEPFDRFAMFEESRGKSASDLLEEFSDLRRRNLDELETLAISGDDLDQTGRHPALGTVKLRELLAAWVVHDLGHLAQISRVMAKRYREQAGPWREYLPILDMGGKSS